MPWRPSSLLCRQQVPETVEPGGGLRAGDQVVRLFPGALAALQEIRKSPNFKDTKIVRSPLRWTLSLRLRRPEASVRARFVAGAPEKMDPWTLRFCRLWRRRLRSLSMPTPACGCSRRAAQAHRSPCVCELAFGAAHTASFSHIFTAGGVGGISDHFLQPRSFAAQVEPGVPFGDMVSYKEIYPISNKAFHFNKIKKVRTGGYLQ